MPYEISQILISNLSGLYIDATFGGGGHTSYLIEKYKNIKVIAIDWDNSSQEKFESYNSTFKDRVIFVRENFKNIKSIIKNLNIEKVDGILADIGASSKHFDDLSRGFSFKSLNLDMRMDNRANLTAKEVINSYAQDTLADIFYKYGEEYQSRQIAEAIIKHRKNKIINTARELSEIVYLNKKKDSAIHPATKIFQALRIYINNELENLEIFLNDAPNVLNKGGVLSIITFHSLEDRIVKQNFKENSKNGIYKILNKKVIKPKQEEVKTNLRARSAKLRTAEKI
jgi:16S rRNA (cytosine1402-N4)-methyltransferase